MVMTHAISEAKVIGRGNRAKRESSMVGMINVNAFLLAKVPKEKKDRTGGTGGKAVRLTLVSAPPLLM
jgi:hypothetical protein